MGVPVKEVIGKAKQFPLSIKCPVTEGGYCDGIIRTRGRYVAREGSNTIIKGFIKDVAFQPHHAVIQDHTCTHPVGKLVFEQSVGSQRAVGEMI